MDERTSAVVMCFYDMLWRQQEGEREERGTTC